MTPKGAAVIVLGIILILLGFLLPLPILYTIGVIVLVIGLVLLALGHFGGHPVGGRRYWY